VFGHGKFSPQIVGRYAAGGSRFLTIVDSQRQKIGRRFRGLAHRRRHDGRVAERRDRTAIGQPRVFASRELYRIPEKNDIRPYIRIRGRETSSCGLSCSPVGKVDSVLERSRRTDGQPSFEVTAVVVVAVLAGPRRRTREPPTRRSEYHRHSGDTRTLAADRFPFGRKYGRVDRANVTGKRPNSRYQSITARMPPPRYGETHVCAAPKPAGTVVPPTAKRNHYRRERQMTNK